MKKILVVVLVQLFAIAYVYLGCQQKQLSPENRLSQLLIAQVDSFANICKAMEKIATGAPLQRGKLQDLFLEARIAYKKFEWAAEYFEPLTSRFVNGPPVPEIEFTGQVFEPAGLQVIENFIFPNFDSSKRPGLLKQLKLLELYGNKYKNHFANIAILDWQVFDAVKLEVFRIETTGITGFDNPLTLKSIKESAVSLEALQKVINLYDNDVTSALNETFLNSGKYLLANPDFNSFDRAYFIKSFCNPLTAGIAGLEVKLKINVTRYNRLLNQDAKTLFDIDAYNVNAYSPDQSSFITDEKIALGKKLFADPVLSGNGIRSCKSCHQPEKAFTDGLVKNTMLSSDKTLERNTPTLINAALQSAQFYDLRVNTLEDQSRDVVQSTVEMHGSMQLSVKKLMNDALYRQMFSAAFPKSRKSIDTLEVMNAIASYVRSLVFLNSRFDEYMRDEKQAMAANEINGFNLFMGKAKCATCHYMPLFNGTLPPRYMKTEAEVIGVPQSLQETEIDTDFGRYNIVRSPSLKYAFKIPTIRNAARTAPYMHNGVFISLEQVLNFYNNGGGAGLGFKINNLTLPTDTLGLSKKEMSDIIAFIKCLDSR